MEGGELLSEFYSIPSYFMLHKLEVIPLDHLGPCSTSGIKESYWSHVFLQAGIEYGDTLDEMLGIVLHKAKTAKVSNECHFIYSDFPTFLF